jgi:hypothetical protein
LPDAPLGKASAIETTLDRADDFFIRPRLLPDELVVEPHAEFTAIADDQFRVDADRLFDERRHTGGAREVVSDPAVPNANM